MKTFKITYALLIALILTTFGCSNDDEVIKEVNLENLVVTIDENPTNGDVIGTIVTDGSGDLNFSIVSQSPIGALTINSSTGELTVANVGLFDFEINPVITASITATNAVNPAAVTINLTNVNEVNLQDLTLTIDENPANGHVLGTIQTNASGTQNLSISSQTPAGAITIDSGSGELTVVDASLFDFETNPTITATIAAADVENMATVTINLTNINELNAQDLTVAIDENPTSGQIVGTIQVNGGTLSYTITTQTPAGALNINTSTGELTVADPNLFDFETNPVITATIQIDDVVDTTMVTATINLNDVDEITVQPFNATIDENPAINSVIGTLQATGGNLTYSITFQNPAGAFAIDQNTGELSVADETLFDFETNPNMLVTISVDNGTYSVSANAFVSLNDLNEGTPATIGDFRDGGVVIWVDPSDNTKGLVCALSDQSSGAEWGCEGVSVAGTDSIIGSGAANTVAIETSCTSVGTAADIVANLSLSSYNDWFLPSIDELNEMFLNRTAINSALTANGGSAFDNSFYWSSTQGNANASYFQFLGNQSLQSLNSKSNMSAVRAVRAF